MAVREFDGIDDELVCGVGGASGMTFGTVVELFKFSTVTGFRAIGNHLHNSSSTFISVPLGLSNFGAYETFSGSSISYTTNPSTGIWYLAVWRKVTGTAAPRLSTYDFNSTTWTHRNGSGSVGNWTAPGVSGETRFSFQGGSDFFGGRIAARAYWSNSLPWSADTTGDTALIAAGLEVAASNWFALGPSAMWRFDQASVGTPVTDDVGSGADETSIVGTTVITGDDPPGFSFSLGGSPPVLEEGPLTATGRSNLRLG
jgi:hypothetical protein